MQRTRTGNHVFRLNDGGNRFVHAWFCSFYSGSVLLWLSEVYPLENEYSFMLFLNIFWCFTTKDPLGE